MPKYFVTDPPVPVWEFDPAETLSDVQPNVIWIKSKMDVATAGKVQSELFTFNKEGGGMEAHVGENQTALLIHNIVRWEGPDLGGVPCTPEKIRTLDPNEPHIAAVLEEIAGRNKKRASPNPKLPASTNGATSGIEGRLTGLPVRAPSSLELATGKPRSSLLSAMDGHLNRSDDSILTS